MVTYRAARGIEVVAIVYTLMQRDHRRRQSQVGIDAHRALKSGALARPYFFTYKLVDVRLHGDTLLGSPRRTAGRATTRYAQRVPQLTN